MVSQEWLEVGKTAAKKAGLKVCPNCLGAPVMWAGDKMHDYSIECTECDFSVYGTNIKQAIRKWNDDQNNRRQKTIEEKP